MSEISFNSPIAPQIAARFLGQPPQTLREQTGGLSGARVWRVESARRTYVLRQYPPEFPTEERLVWLHTFLQEVQTRGCSQLPCPVAASDGATWIRHESQFWELLTWVHGEPMLETSASPALLITGTASLATLHQQLARTNDVGKFDLEWPLGRSAGLLERLKLLESWSARDRATVEAKIASGHHWPELSRLYFLQRDALARHQSTLQTQLHAASSAAVPIFPVLRDVQPEHVLFRDNQVAGFIDVGAMRFDTPMADLARLLQRWRFTEPEWYAAAIAAYKRIRPLAVNEQLVLDAYDSSARLLTGVQWLCWILLEGREFANRELVEQRLGRICRELERQC